MPNAPEQCTQGFGDYRIIIKIIIITTVRACWRRRNASLTVDLHRYTGPPNISSDICVQPQWQQVPVEYLCKMYEDNILLHYNIIIIIMFHAWQFIGTRPQIGTYNIIRSCIPATLWYYYIINITSLDFFHKLHMHFFSQSLIL